MESEQTATNSVCFHQLMKLLTDAHGQMHGLRQPFEHCPCKIYFTINKLGTCHYVTCSVAGISTALCRHRMFVQSKIAIACVHIGANL